jgi:hypothetical protein
MGLFGWLFGGRKYAPREALHYIKSQDVFRLQVLPSARPAFEKRFQAECKKVGRFMKRREIERLVQLIINEGFDQKKSLDSLKKQIDGLMRGLHVSTSKCASTLESHQHPRFKIRNIKSRITIILRHMNDLDVKMHEAKRYSPLYYEKVSHQYILYKHAVHELRDWSISGGKDHQQAAARIRAYLTKTLKGGREAARVA